MGVSEGNNETGDRYKKIAIGLLTFGARDTHKNEHIRPDTGGLWGRAVAAQCFVEASRGSLVCGDRKAGEARTTRDQSSPTPGASVPLNPPGPVGRLAAASAFF